MLNYVWVRFEESISRVCALRQPNGVQAPSKADHRRFEVALYLK